MHAFNGYGRRKAGFTLIELLMAVLIIGILAAVAVPQYTKSVEKARAAEAYVLAKSFVDAEQSYFMANGDYEKDLSKLDIRFPVTQVGEGKFKTRDFNIVWWYSSKAGLIIYRDYRGGQYGLNVDFKNREITCLANKPDAAAMCKSMGFTDMFHTQNVDQVGSGMFEYFR